MRIRKLGVSYYLSFIFFFHIKRTIDSQCMFCVNIYSFLQPFFNDKHLLYGENE